MDACYDARMRTAASAVVAALLWVCGGGLVSAAPPVDPLADARLRLARGDVDGALASADGVRGDGVVRSRADIIAARALLDRYRATGAATDLIEARRRLTEVDASALSARERDALAMGYGIALHLEGASAAAALVFDPLLTTPRPDDDYQRLLDWWATATATAADRRAVEQRRSDYVRLQERLQAERRARGPGAVLSYWLVAAARGAGDLEGAWAAAQAAWAQAPALGASAAPLRDDISRLVTVALAPERARASGQPLQTVLDDWHQFTATWGGAVAGTP